MVQDRACRGEQVDVRSQPGCRGTPPAGRPRWHSGWAGRRVGSSPALPLTAVGSSGAKDQMVMPASYLPPVRRQAPGPPPRTVWESGCGPALRGAHRDPLQLTWAQELHLPFPGVAGGSRGPVHLNIRAAHSAEWSPEGEAASCWARSHLVTL